MFTSDWFSSNIASIRQTLQGKIVHDILEIGSWEGRSALWFLQSFPKAQITCIDTFDGSYEHEEAAVVGLEERFHRNVMREEYKSRVTLLKGQSAKMLKYLGLHEKTFDVVYVDGSHAAWDCMQDLVLSWSVLNPGGVMLIDDYGGGDQGVPLAVDTFLQVVPGCKTVQKGYQLHLQKSGKV